VEVVVEVVMDRSCRGGRILPSTLRHASNRFSSFIISASTRAPWRRARRMGAAAEEEGRGFGRRWNLRGYGLLRCLNAVGSCVLTLTPFSSSSV
jgi:hypothetical protein